MRECVSPELLLARAGERVVQCSFTLACCVSGGFGARLCPKIYAGTAHGICFAIRVLRVAVYRQGDASQNYDDDCTAREAVLVCGYSYSGVDISFVYGGAAADGSSLSEIVRLLWGLPGLGRRARRLVAILQRGVPARALGRGAQGRVPVHA